MSDFPTLLRQARRSARLSQLAAAAEAGVSARHLACLETARARPSRAMVLRLAEALDQPPAATNALLHAAGFAPIYGQTPLDAPGLAPVLSAFERMLEAHDPFPGFVLDRFWRLVRLNGAARALLAPLSLGQGDSLLSVLARPGVGAEVIENWAEVAHHLSVRLRTESRAQGGNETLDAAAAALARDPALMGHVPQPHRGPVLNTRFRTPEGPRAFWSMMVQPAGIADLTLADLRLELMYPAQ